MNYGKKKNITKPSTAVDDGAYSLKKGKKIKKNKCGCGNKKEK
jgi:hypothetical protein